MFHRYGKSMKWLASALVLFISFQIQAQFQDPRVGLFNPQAFLPYSPMSNSPSYLTSFSGSSYSGPNYISSYQRMAQSTQSTNWFTNLLGSGVGIGFQAFGSGRDDRDMNEDEDDDLYWDLRQNYKREPVDLVSAQTATGLGSVRYRERLNSSGVLSDLAISESRLAKKYSCSSEKDSTTEDLRKYLPQTSHQDTYLWCFGITAADLLTVHMKLDKKISITEQVSSADVVVSYQEGGYGNPGRGGSTAMALAAAKQKGVCLESGFPSVDSGLAEAAETVAKSDTYNAISGKGVGKTAACTNSNQTEIIKKESLLAQNQIAEQQKKYFNMYYATGSQACKRTDISAVGQVYNEIPTNEVEKEVMFDLVDEQLNSGKPISLTINEKLLQPLSGNSGLHEVLLLQAKCESGQKKYLVRNSWGRNCSIYKEPVRKNCDSNGDIWLTKEQIKAEAYAITYIKK